MKNAWLLGIVALALLLRVYRLAEVPVGFHGDEASIGYNAYSLLKTGKDQNNNVLPLAIDQFGDFRPAGYHYLTIPFVAVFGLTELAVRLPSALLGGLSVVPFALLLYQLFKRQQLVLLGGLLLAISPWHIALSRATSESVVALFLVLWGAYFFVRFGKNLKNLWYAGFFFFLSFFFYHSARLFVPLLVLVYTLLRFFEAKSDVQKQKPLLWFTAGIVVASVVIFFVSYGRGRVRQVSILRSPGDMQTLREQVLEDVGVVPWAARALHNKVTHYLITVARNYFEHFTGNFLFLEGGQPVRYRVPWSGLMYLIEAPAVAIGFIGLIVFITRTKNQLGAFPLLWLFLAPIPAALTFGELPNVQRALFMVPSLVLLSAYSIVLVVDKTVTRLRTFLVVGLILAYGYEGVVFFHNYFHHSYTHEPWYRNVGEKELVFDVARFAAEGKKVVMTSQNDNNLVFHLFYTRFDPAKYQALGSPRDKDNLQFGNLTFTYRHCPLEGSEQDAALGELGVMYVNRGECKLPKNSELLKDITRLDDSIAFRILQIKPSQ